MNTLEKLPVTVVTGFLGSGKTTLIRHLMQNPGGKRLAVVVNEFGDVGVDGEILKGCAIPDCPEENIMELANGCICCTVADDFIPTIEALMALEPRPDHILIEATRRDAARGLLDIERLGLALKRIRRHIRHKRLDRISPLAVPVLLDIGKEPIFGEAREAVLREAAEDLIAEAIGTDIPTHRG